MDRNFELAAKNWLDQCSADLKGKIEGLLDENNSSPEELADAINVETEEIYSILEGDVENISVETLVKAFMVLGLAVEIKPIAATPLRTYNNVNPHVMRDINVEGPEEEEEEFEVPQHRAPRPNPFSRPMPPMGGGFDPNRIPPHIRERIERDFGMGHEPSPAPVAPRMKRPEAPTSPFATKSREELAHIIRKHLWDSEIDINTASREALVRFLDEKDNRKKAFERNESVENDPRVADFIKSMKKGIKENPQLRSYINQFLKNVEE